MLIRSAKIILIHKVLMSTIKKSFNKMILIKINIINKIKEKTI